MLLLRRGTALLVTLLLGQLTLVGTAERCSTHGRPGQPGGSGAESTAQMAMTGMAMGDEAAGLGAECSECETPAEHAPCSLPRALGGCSTMLSCAAPMPPVESVATMPSLSSATDAPTAAVVAVPNPTSAPELPPPRA